ncbi:ABC transporter permease [Flammeovirga agarivorans]|uniref:FtsX-like permease family protein n=1 Tax=Flammeovirga agarivorans TaxID=2726742 RepID=A0A7X8SHV7_9BACT|nr:FtsX-like permease family protein [Flammeovirga agarivorans]NLR90540.1 FtsX-like permease family protein [Flammeovirga agarivorans]
MIKHLLNILWTRKKKNTLMIIEITFSFVILFLLFSLLYKKLENYSHPTGFSTENIMIMTLDTNSETEEEEDQIYEAITQSLLSNEEIVDVTEMDYSHSYFGSRNTTRYTFENGITFWPTEQRLRPHAVKFMNFNFVKGRGFTAADKESSKETIIVNQQLYDKLSPYLDADDSFGSEERGYQIVGVIDYYNFESDLADQEDIVLRNADNLDWLKDSHQSKLFIRTKNDPRKIEAQTVSRIEKLSNKLRVKVLYFDNLQDEKNNYAMLPLFLISFVALFLVCNIALGLYGVLWYNISKRKSEIGIRRAMGASTQDIFKQIFSEVFLLFIIGTSLGSIIAIQFPLLGAFNFTNSIYLIGALLSLVFVLLITIICGYYPSKLAMKITPNEALNEL